MSAPIPMPNACVICGQVASPPNPSLKPDQTWGVMLPSIPADGQAFIDPNRGVAICLQCLSELVKSARAAKEASNASPK